MKIQTESLEKLQRKKKKGKGNTFQEWNNLAHGTNNNEGQGNNYLNKNC